MSFPSEAFGGWMPKPMKDSAASMRIAAAMNERHGDDDRADAVREDVPDDDAHVACARGLRRLDELLLAQREEQPADDSREAHPEEDARMMPIIIGCGMVEVVIGPRRHSESFEPK